MKRLVLGLVLAVCSTFAVKAQMTSSVGLTWLPNYNDADLGSLTGSLGYRFERPGGWSFQPEFRAGVGVVDDTVPLFSMSAVALVPTDVELEYLLGAAARVQYEMTGGFYLYAQPTLTRLEIDAGSVTSSFVLEDTEWEFGGDVGAGFPLGEHFGLEGSYGILGGETVVNTALRVHF
jgi:hypothetical protein